MNTAQPNISEKLFTLQEAAQRLNVSVETLISWNEHSILKPTITKHGAVGYTEYQLIQFLSTIQQVIQQANPANQSIPSSSLTGAVQQHAFVTAQIPTPVAHNTKTTTDTTSEGKYAYSKRVIALAVIVILLTAVFTQEDASTPSTALDQAQQKFANVLGFQTSQLTVSEQILAALPIQMKSDQSSERALHEKETSVFKEKTTAPALYTSKATNTKDENATLAATSKQPGYKAGSTIAINPNSYTATGFFQSQQDATSAIDEHGNIRGETTADTLASVVGGIDEQSSILQQSSTHATNQLILIFLGMFAVLFAFQKQFAFVQPARKLTISHEPLITPTPIAETKILEIDQKTDGSVVLYLNGNEYKISKPEMNSESDQFIERLMTLTQYATKEIEYDTAAADAIRFATPLSRLVTRLGFVGIKRDLFFPRTSKTSVLFRKYLTKQDLADMNITLDHIRNELDLLS